MNLPLGLDILARINERLCDWTESSIPISSHSLRKCRAWGSEMVGTLSDPVLILLFHLKLAK
jgi:hypothetical protein